MSRSGRRKTSGGRNRSPLSRRQFLVHSAGIAGASFGLGVGPRRAQGGGNEEIGLAILGAGERGTRLLTAALQCERVRIVAVADVHPRNRLRARDIARDHEPELASEPERLLELAAAAKLDAVLIATPPHLHRDQAVEALRSGLHVYLEKPMGLSVAESEEVRREATEAAARGQVFQIGLQRRYNPRYLAGIEAIRRGDAGAILFTRAQWHNVGNPARSKSWYYRRERSGDLIVEQGCHQMDVFNWVFDAVPEKVCGLGGVNRFEEEPPGRSIRDHYGLLLEYPGGGKVHYSHLTYAVPDRRFSGIYELVFGEKLGLDLANGLAWDRSGKTIRLTTEGGSDTRKAVEGFFGHIRHGQAPQASAEVGHRATVASLLGRETLDTGRVLRWEDLAGPRDPGRAERPL